VDGPLKIALKNITDSNQKIDLLILTHIDDDHIDGALKWFKEDINAPIYINEVWFNSGRLVAKHLSKLANLDLDITIDINQSNKTSVDQGVEFGKYIREKGIWFENVVMQGDLITRWGLEFKILSPDKNSLERLLKLWKKSDPDLKTSAKDNDYHISISDHIKSDEFNEDDRVANGSSIAFIATWKKQNFLFLGDAHPSVIVDGLKLFSYGNDNPVSCTITKLSHHGSSGNSSSQLLKCINCSSFVISTDGNNHGHPHKQMLSRLIHLKPESVIWFTYGNRMKLIFSENDFLEHKSFRAFEITNEFSF
jgi:beta-lactamase superfamily II metal-dependent hydrolase